MVAARGARAGELLAVLAHELRNPLASLQGCAMTLLERRHELSDDMQEGLTRVIVDQSQRLDWIVRATAAYGGASTRRDGGFVNTAAVVRQAADFAEVKADARDGYDFEGDERRVQLALEAILVSLRNSQADVDAALVSGGASFEIRSRALDLGHGGRGWKLELARRLLREEGCALSIRRLKDGTLVRVRFPRSAAESEEAESK